MIKPPYRVPSMTEIAEITPNGYTVASTFSGCGGSSLGYRMAGFKIVYANEFVPAAQETYRANAAPGTYLDAQDIRGVTGDDLLKRCGLDVGELDLLDGSPPCSSFSTAGARANGWGKVKKYSDTEQRTDDLFYEYARLVMQTQPRVFVAENVSGLVKGTAKGYFINIMRTLKACGYRVEAKVLDAQWLGVPQARQRLIFVGVRNDLGRPPVFPAPLPYRYTVRDAIPLILKTGGSGQYGTVNAREATQPSVTIGAKPQTGNGRSPGAFVLAADTITADPETGQDIRLDQFAVGRAWAQVARNGCSRVSGIVRTDPGKPASDEPGLHPATARKFTLTELRRISGFPDDFTLKGSYEQRWERLGRAVPPIMMAAIATAVRDRILTPASKQ